MKTCWGNGGIAPLILNLGIRMKEVAGQLHAMDALPQGKSIWYPLGRSLVGSQSLSGRGGEEKDPLITPAGD
jgi:hypothetical protein